MHTNMHDTRKPHTDIQTCICMQPIRTYIHAYMHTHASFNDEYEKTHGLTHKCAFARNCVLFVTRISYTCPHNEMCIDMSTT